MAACASGSDALPSGCGAQARVGRQDVAGCGAAFIIALGAYRMPVNLAVDAVVYGAAYGLLPIGWIVFTALLLYRLAVETGQFEIIKDSIGHLTQDTYMQALVIAFAFGAFIEGASRFRQPGSRLPPRCLPDWAWLRLKPPPFTFWRIRRPSLSALLERPL